MLLTKTSYSKARRENIRRREVDRMPDGDIQVGNGRIVRQAEKVDWRCQVLAGQSLQRRHTLRKILLVPLRNVTAGLHSRRQGRSLSEVSMDDGIQEPDLSNGEVPGQDITGIRPTRMEKLMASGRASSADPKHGRRRCSSRPRGLRRCG